MVRFESDNPDRTAPAEKHPVTLSAADAAAVDAVLDRSGNIELKLASAASHGAKADAADLLRQARVRQVLGALKNLPEPVAPADLVQRTLAAVRDDRMRVVPADMASPQRRDEEDAVAERGINLSRRLSQLGALAVAASIVVAVLIPGLGQLRQKAYVSTCAANMEHLKDGFAAYALAHGGNLPRLDNGDGNWLALPERVSGHSNTANLLPLFQQGYAKADDLVCPGRGGVLRLDANARDIPDGQRGYSYANMYGAIRPQWDGRNATIVLADRNPLFGPEASDDAQDNSINHRRAGENALAADGSVVFVSGPNIGPNGDNIWTVAEGKSYHRGYNGTETVESADDVFLAP